jgi:hypothetical protein
MTAEPPSAQGDHRHGPRALANVLHLEPTEPTVLACQVKFFAFPFLASLLVLAGCGGNVVSRTETATVDNVYGLVSTRSVGGVAEPVTMQGSQSSVTGVFGANFLTAAVTLPPENQLNELALLSTTMLVYSDNARPVLLDYGTGTPYALNPAAPFSDHSCSPTFSGNGAQVASVEYDTVSSSDIFTYNIDGSSRTKIPNTSNAVNPNWSPVSSKIAFSSAGDIWVVSTNGTGLTQLTFNTDAESKPRWNPSGTKIGYIRVAPGVLGAAGIANLWEMDATGGQQRQVVAGLGSIQSWDYDPTGDEVIFVADHNGGRSIYRLPLAGGPKTELLFTTDVITSVTWSPQGSHVAYIREGAAGSGRIEALRLSDNTTSTVKTLATTVNANRMEWGPLVRKRSFIAASSPVLGTNAAGFLYGMVRSNFASFLAFDAITRSSVDIDVPPPGGISPTNFFATITAADSITMLRYVNGFSTPKITVVDPAVASNFVQGAVVSFDASNGTVAAVIPFNRSRSGEKPTRTEQDGKVTYRGEFLGVWDEKGKNHDGPATEVTMDLRTGKVLSHH